MLICTLPEGSKTSAFSIIEDVPSVGNVELGENGAGSQCGSALAVAELGDVGDQAHAPIPEVDVHRVIVIEGIAVVRSRRNRGRRAGRPRRVAAVGSRWSRWAAAAPGIESRIIGVAGVVLLREGSPGRIRGSEAAAFPTGSDLNREPRGFVSVKDRSISIQAWARVSANSSGAVRVRLRRWLPSSRNAKRDHGPQVGRLGGLAHDGGDAGHLVPSEGARFQLIVLQKGSWPSPEGCHRRRRPRCKTEDHDECGRRRRGQRDECGGIGKNPRPRWGDCG